MDVCVFFFLKKKEEYIFVFGRWRAVIPCSVLLYGAVCLGRSGGSPFSFVRRPFLCELGVVEFALAVVSSRQGFLVARVGGGVLKIFLFVITATFSHLRGGVCRCHHTHG